VPEAKPWSISKHLVVKAYRLVKANHGAAGVDRQSVEAFEADLKGNLYKIWNRMSSGSYFPPPVRLVEIPKGDGRMRPLGIPTVADRIAQMVAKLTLEPLVEPVFHQDSYGYRPGKSALDAVGVARKRCWRMDWVIDLDIRDFFGSLDHDLMMKAVKHHTELKWIHLYVERWLMAAVQREDGSLEARTAGTPQGGVISPLLANLFMHYAFDEWMRRTHPSVPFERYADDVVIHCVNQAQARSVLEAVRRRMGECKLELHPEKTKVVYCKDDRRRDKFSEHKFDFLGYTFRPRGAWGPSRKTFVGFLPAMSDKAAKKIRETIRGWCLSRRWNRQPLDVLARLINPVVRGWVTYYGRYYRSRCLQVLGRSLTVALVKWAMRKYKRFRGRWVRAYHWLGRVAAREGELFVHWCLGARPPAGR
jgi:group II intron reverse transcriptase/maturase